MKNNTPKSCTVGRRSFLQSLALGIAALGVPLKMPVHARPSQVPLVPLPRTETEPAGVEAEVLTDPGWSG